MIHRHWQIQLLCCVCLFFWITAHQKNYNNKAVTTFKKVVTLKKTACNQCLSTLFQKCCDNFVTTSKESCHAKKPLIINTFSILWQLWQLLYIYIYRILQKNNKILIIIILLYIYLILSIFCFFLLYIYISLKKSCHTCHRH